jgi:hypothetical protein
MLALIGDLGQPVTRLRVHIGQVREGAQRPEILADIADGPLHFSFFPGRRDMTGSGNEIKFASEGEEAGVEPQQVAFMFGDCRGKIVEPDFVSGATQELKSVDVTARGFEVLPVRELSTFLFVCEL